MGKRVSNGVAGLLTGNLSHLSWQTALPKTFFGSSEDRKWNVQPTWRKEVGVDGNASREPQSAQSRLDLTNLVVSHFSELSTRTRTHIMLARHTRTAYFASLF